MAEKCISPDSAGMPDAARALNAPDSTPEQDMTYNSLPPQSATVTSLQAYSRVLGSIRGAQSEPHPRWWHASLHITADGLATGDFPLGNSKANLVLEPANRLVRGAGADGGFEVALNGPASAVGREILDRLGAPIDVDPERWDAISSETYDTEEAANYHQALLVARDTFAGYAATIEGEVGPINFWPHHFDMSFEWFSDAVEVYEEEDGPKEYNKQVGFGFSPGDEGDAQPYFYANPWPFDESFRSIELPSGASWHGEGWSGGFLPYSAVVDGGEGLLINFMQAVFEGTREALS